mgnify:CR=1 FL=1
MFQILIKISARFLLVPELHPALFPFLIPYGFQFARTLSCLLLAGITVAACWFFAGRYGVFGANMDWISQHSVIPDYFRKQFYETGNLFPEFAMNLGGG